MQTKQLCCALIIAVLLGLAQAQGGGGGKKATTAPPTTPPLTTTPPPTTTTVAATTTPASTAPVRIPNCPNRDRCIYLLDSIKTWCHGENGTAPCLQLFDEEPCAVTDLECQRSKCNCAVCERPSIEGSSGGAIWYYEQECADLRCQEDFTCTPAPYKRK